MIFGKMVQACTAIAVTGFLLSSASASAVTFASAQKLHDACRLDSSGDSACFFYSVAIADVLSTNVINNFRACIPAEVKADQVRDVVAKWLEDHPELRHYAASGVVAEGLRAAFPC